MNPRVVCFDLFFDDQFVGKLPLTRTKITIGRSRGCDLRLIDVSISRRHFSILLSEDGQITLEDLASTNGTFLNHKRVMSAPLMEGDSITAGRCSLALRPVDPEALIDTDQSLWKKMAGKLKLPPLSKPHGKYLFLDIDTMTEFDAVAFSMTQDHKKNDDQPSTGRTFLKQIPRLQVLTTDTPTMQEEVTKFSVSKNVFADAAPKAPDNAHVIFMQPRVKARKFKMPWKSIELILIPSVLVILGIVVGKYFLTAGIDNEFKKMERRWEEQLVKVADRYRYDNAFTPTDSSPEVTTADKNQPLSDSDVWKKIDARPSLRNFLLFEILDDLIRKEDVKWSFEVALANLSKLESITSRLPSVKRMNVVLNSEAADIHVAGLLSQRLLFFAQQKAQTEVAQDYREYKSNVSGHIASVASCSGVRKASLPGNVVTAFTISKTGKATAVFVNENQSTKEKALWDCIRTKLALAKFDPPPQGNALSIVYTFKFVGPTKVEF